MILDPAPLPPTTAPRLRSGRTALRWALALGALGVLAGALTAYLRFSPVLSLVLREPAEVEVPVEGVRKRDLVSTFGAPRDGGLRTHRGADIFARKGVPVRSATAGWVIRVGNDRLGGRVVKVLGEGRAVYYYAHLDDFAPDLHEGQKVAAGATLGFVGNTGNAKTTPAHLHFGVYRLGLLGARAVDPVPWLKLRASR